MAIVVGHVACAVPFALVVPIVLDLTRQIGSPHSGQQGPLQVLHRFHDLFYDYEAIKASPAKDSGNRPPARTNAASPWRPWESSCIARSVAGLDARPMPCCRIAYSAITRPCIVRTHCPPTFTASVVSASCRT